MKRPSEKWLLADITAGKIDIFVVYKVDRLTRALLDFAKLVEAFDKAGTSFVSISQSFNTATSIGRLTHNILLTLAQFEHEVTAERIRDKIAASKAKGMWMGGTPPLGYRSDGCSLAVAEGACRCHPSMPGWTLAWSGKWTRCRGAGASRPGGSFPSRE